MRDVLLSALCWVRVNRVLAHIAVSFSLVVKSSTVDAKCLTASLCHCHLRGVAFCIVVFNATRRSFAASAVASTGFL